MDLCISHIIGLYDNEYIGTFFKQDINKKEISSNNTSHYILYILQPPEDNVLDKDKKRRKHEWNK